MTELTINNPNRLLNNPIKTEGDLLKYFNNYVDINITLNLKNFLMDERKKMQH